MAWLTMGRADPGTPQFMKSRSRVNYWLILIIAVLTIFIFSAWSSSSLDLSHMKDVVVNASTSTKVDSIEIETNYSAPSTGPIGDKIIVMAHRESEDTSWVAEYLPDWQRAIYSVDNETAPLHVNFNRGREANVYLEYIVTHYEHLPEIIVFIHAHHDGINRGWHVDAPGFDNVYQMNKLKLDFVRQNGYANLRCQWQPGCPDEIQPFRDHEGMDIENMGDKRYICESQIRRVWPEIFGNNDIPEVIAAPCCAQFAVTREQVHKRTVEEYQHYHRWLQGTDINEGDLGRIFEYLWHIIFGQEPIYCPETQMCYTDVYGSGW